MPAYITTPVSRQLTYEAASLPNRPLDGLRRPPLAPWRVDAALVEGVSQIIEALIPIAHYFLMIGRTNWSHSEDLQHRRKFSLCVTYV